MNRDNLLKVGTRWLVPVLVLLMQLLPGVSPAQYLPQDPLSLEAYIHDHKQQRSILLVRAGIEEANTLLHKASQVTNKDYRDINDELDRYTRAFDIIDFVYQSVYTGFNVYRTVGDVREKISAYGDMLAEYNDKVLKRGKIESADTLLITVNARAVRDLANEVENLYHHIVVLAAYCTSKVPCKTATLSLMVENVNLSLEHIHDIVNRAYYQTYRFIEARTRLWKRELYRSKTVRQMADEAFGRWQRSWGGVGY